MTHYLLRSASTCFKMKLSALANATEPTEAIRIVQQSVDAFAADAHAILQKHESSTKSRVITLGATQRKLSGLSVSQNELLQEALGCIEHGLLRAAHVSAWQAFMDFLEEKLESDGLVAVHAAWPGWTKYKTMDDIRDDIGEFQIIDAAYAVKLIKKGEKKSLHGLLSTRNECAHPTTYRPTLNEALGYVSGLITRIAEIQSRTL